MRPRICEGIVWFQMVSRKRPLTMSAAPAMARQATAASEASWRNRGRQSQRPTASRPARLRPMPCDLRRPATEERSITRLPTLIAEYRYPTAYAPPHCLEERETRPSASRECHGKNVYDVRANGAPACSSHTTTASRIAASPGAPRFRQPAANGFDLKSHERQGIRHGMLPARKLTVL